MAGNVTPIGGFSHAGAEMLHQMAENSTLFTEYLKFHGRMFKHTPSVTLEFFVQKPESRFVATQMQWERAGNPVVPGSDGIRFRDSQGKVIDLYDFSQCRTQAHEPYQWRMTESGEESVRNALNLSLDQSFLTALVNRAVTPEIVTGTMQRLNVPPQNTAAFHASFHRAVAAIIAGRMEVGGNSFPVQADASIIRNMTSTQQLSFITMAAVSAKKVLNQVEQVMNDRRATMQSERMVQNEVRGISETDSRGDGTDSGRRITGSAAGAAAQFPDKVQSDSQQGRHPGLGSGTGYSRGASDILPAAAEKPADRKRDLLVSGKSYDRDIRNADGTGRSDNRGGPDRQLRFDMDVLDGGKSSGEGGGNAFLPPVSDGGTVGGQESLGVPEQTGQAVPVGESPSPRLREYSGVGTDESVLYGQRNDEGHRASGSNNSITDKISQAFEMPIEKKSADQTDSVDMHERSLAEQIDAVLQQTDNRYDNSIKMCETPRIYIEAGLSPLPMLYSKKHLREALKPKDAKKPHQHGLTIQQIQSIPELLAQPAMIFDSMSPHENGKNSIVSVLNAVDSDNAPLLVTITPNGQGVYQLESVSANYITSIYGKENNFDAYIERAATAGNILFWDKKKSQDLFSVLGLQLPQGLNNLDSNVIIHKSTAIVNSFAKKPEHEQPITSERRAGILSAFASKYDLDDLDVFVKKDKAYQGNGRAYDLTVKHGKSILFHTQLFTLESGEFFTESVLQSSLENLAVLQDFQSFLASRAAQPTLFDQTEPKKVDTNVNPELETEMNQETVKIRQREIDKTIQSIQRRLEQDDLTPEKQQEYEDTIAFLRSADAAHIELTAEAIHAFREKRTLERAKAQALNMSAASKFINDPGNMPIVVDNMVAGDELGKIAHRILTNHEDTERVAQDYITSGYYSLHVPGEDYHTDVFVQTSAESVKFTTEPDTEHAFDVLYSWAQVGGFLREAAQHYLDVEREAEEAWKRDIAENKEAYDALDHRRDVYLSMPDENSARHTVFDARKPELHNYRLHFEEHKGYLLLADSDTEKDLVLRNFTMVGSSIVLHGVQDMGFTVTSVQPPEQAMTYEIYQMKSDNQHRYYRFESMEANKDADLTVADYDSVYSGNWSEVQGGSVQSKLDALFTQFNIDHPKDYTGHSMSTSDVIVVSEGNTKTAYYVQPIGFVEIPDFFREKHPDFHAEQSDDELDTLPISTVVNGKVVTYSNVNSMLDALDEAKKVDTNVNSVPDRKPEIAGKTEPIEREKKRGRLSKAKELYQLLSEMYPQIVNGERTFEHYEADPDSGYEPLSIEQIGDGLYSFMTTYVQNGDLMRDPDITFMLNHNERTAHVFSFQQDGVPPHGTYYVEVANENGHVDTKLQASLEQTLLQNLKNAQAADRILTRYHDKNGQEVVMIPDMEKVPATEEPTKSVNVDENAHLRQVLNAFSEEYGLGELNLRFTDATHVGIFESYADGSEMQLGVGMYYGDNAQLSPDECKKILNHFATRENQHGRSVEDAMGRKSAIAARGKSELPPVPDTLPEIIYAKAPLQKVRDNLEAIRELQRLARCEQTGRPLYDKKRNQWHCKENSDERLRRYSGWGGLQQVFDAKSGRYADLRQQLQKLLTPEEYESAKASTTDAHYTPQIIIDAMYKAIQNMGIPRDSRVLEPACGTGNFIARMPHSIGNAGVVGVELDSITAQIAARMNADNPKVEILHSAFEQSGQEDNSFDLVIGNVPFGDYKMNDPDYTQDWLIHDAFFRKALDKVAPGGVVAFVTSTGTLDKKNPKVREHLAAQADLIGAIRLPNTAFSDAGTGVPTDIVFLQKRSEPLSPDAPKPDWCYVAPISESEQNILINSYFVQNPQMILGTMRKTSFQDRLTCDPIDGTDLKKQLDNAVQQLNAKLLVTKREKAAKERRGYIQPWGKQFTYQEKDKKIYYNEGATMREIIGSAKDIDMLKRLIALRTLARQLIDKQKTAAEDHELMPLRQSLNQQYDDFTAKYGNINSDAVKKAFAADADYSLLQSLEEYDPEAKAYYKAEIFHKRTVNPVVEITAVDTLEEAFQVSLDQLGKPSIPYMATLLQAQHSDTPFTELTQHIQKELLDQGMVFVDPEKEVTGEPFSGIVERAEYLSGNVRRKLAYAQDRAEENPEFQKNVDALKAIIPPDIHAEEIAVRMGCPWIDPEDYTKFLQELSGRRSWDTRCEVKYSPVTGEFDILQAGSRKDINVNEGTTYGTDKLTMYEIAQKMLNQRRIAVMTTVPSPKDASKMISRTDPVETRKAMEKAKLIEAKFSEWIFSDPERKARYERRYNDLFNSLIGRKYDGSHLTFSGQSAAFSLRPHQRDCVARAVYGGNTLAAHVVGAGKSAVFQTAVMKKKQLGLINKACVVVPKPLMEQTAREWRKLYPDAKLLTMSAADLSSEEKRDLFTARVATGDYDAVIVSVEQFEKMPMSQAFQQKYLQRQLDELEDMLRETKSANGNRRDATTKQIEAAKKKLKVRLENIMNPKSKQKGKDILLDFEQLGFDYLVVDEAHGYKNGFVSTKMGNVSGVTTAASGKAQDMQMKCDYFNEQLGQGHLLFCTGTPVSNSMTELYVMLRYLRPDLLAAAGVERFDDWAATFGKVTTQHKQSATGELKLKTAFSKFANLPELMSMYKEFADIQSAKKLDLPRPTLKTGKPQIISVPASPEQKDFVKALVERAKRISEGSVDPHDDNMLVITNEARLTGLCNAAVAALLQKHEIDLPEGFTDAKTSKVDACVDKVLEVYKDTTEQKGVQIVFSDVAVNSDGGNFSVYDYIRSELIAKGIPAEEIIFAPKSEAKNREDIFRDINAGKYRIVIASTSTLGTGANVQERLAAVHHVDIPWKPSDFEQREGRILRQGNSFSEVQIFNYITEGTMDSYLYQVVTDKARFIAQLLDDETPARVSEDCDDKVLTYGEMQAAAEGNDNFRKRIELGMKVSELQFAKAEFQRETGEIRKTVAAIPDQIASLRDRIGSIACDIETVDRMRNAEGKIEGLTIMTATGHTLTKQEDINQFLHGLLIQKQKAPFDEVPAFKIDAFQVTVEMDGSQQDFAFAVKGASPVAYRTAAEVHDKSNNAQRLLNLLNNSVANEKTKCENRIEKLNTDLIQATERLTIAFPYEQELQQAQSELEQVEAELLGITEMEAAILDPDEQPIEETPKEKNERESFGKIGDADDLNPNTSGEILPPRI